MLWGPVRQDDFIFFFLTGCGFAEQREKKNPKFLSLSGLALLRTNIFFPKYELVLILEVLLEIFPPIHDSFI